MCGLDYRNSTSPRIYPVFDSGGGNEVFQNCKKRCNYARHLKIRFLFDNSAYIIPHASYLQRRIRRQNCHTVFLFAKKTVVRSVALDKS